METTAVTALNDTREQLRPDTTRQTLLFLNVLTCHVTWLTAQYLQ